jgi:hypothetical protein
MMNRKPFAARAHFYFSIFMITLYALTGIMFIFVLKFLPIQSVNRIGAGAVLIAYALYRTYKLTRNPDGKGDLTSTNETNESA